VRRCRRRYTRAPVLVRGGNVLICVYRTSPGAIQVVVPEPLHALPGDLVFAWLNDLHVPEIGLSYHEAIISIPVEFRGKPGQYMAYLYLDSDVAIAGEREIRGFPKKQGRFSFSSDSGKMTRSVERGGIELCQISFQPFGDGKPEDLAALANPIYNLKLIPSVRKEAPPDVKQLTATNLQNVKVYRLMEGDVKLNLGSSREDPLDLLQPVEVWKGIYCELDFDLVHGEVIYEYQKQGQLGVAGVPA
jgi:acetoacetate decarboxylase